MTENWLLLTPSQLRAARAASQCSVEQIAKLAGLGINTIRRLEKGERPQGVTTATLGKLQAAYESLGITFLTDDGVAGSGIRYGGNGTPQIGAQS